MQTTSDQPLFVSLENYDNIDQIRSKFPPLANINIDHNFNNLEEGRFFIIRSQGEDNRAMKYGIWTSSSRKNQKLDEAFKNKKMMFIYSSQKSTVCAFVEWPDQHLNLTQMPILNIGQLRINGLGHFRYNGYQFIFYLISALYQRYSIQILRSEKTLKSVYDLIDCTELTIDNGIKMARIFQLQKINKSLFEEFPQLDKLEFEIRQERMNNIRFEKKFQELSSIFETMPYSFSVASYERKKMNRKAQGNYYQSQYGQQYYYQQQHQQYYQQPFISFYNKINLGYQFQQTPQYWQFNNGCYQNQYEQNQYNNNYHQQDINQQQQTYQKHQSQQNHYSTKQQNSNANFQQTKQNTNQDSNQDVQSLLLEQRFQINNQQLHKKGKFDKSKNKLDKDNVQYVEKNSTEAPEQKS